MKKLLILSLIAFFALGSAKVFADGLTPEAGATHNYWVNSSDAGATQDAAHSGNSYLWYIADGSDLSTALGQTDFSFTSGAYNVLTQDQFAVSIKWNPSSIGKTYYLVVKEQDGNSCTNTKAIEINPTNNFQVVVQNVDDAGTDVGAAKTWCAPDVTLSLNAGAIEYGYGKTTLWYKVDGTGVASDWSFNYAFTQTGKDANSTVTASYGSTAGFASGTSMDVAAGGSISLTGGSQAIYIKVVIDNGTSAEGLTDHDITLTLNNFSDGNNAPTSIDGTASATESVHTQTVNARPATTDPIGHN